jgi:hypothetical protein
MPEQYLVVVRCNMDDIPVFLSPDETEARRVAREIAETEEIPDWMDKIWEEKPTSSFAQVAIVTFSQGRPIDVVTVDPLSA